MARKLIVEILGDSKSLERSFGRSGAASKRFARDTTGALSKADSAFSKTQKIVAGGFLGGAAVQAGITGIKALVNAAAESQQVLGQTKVALEAAGKSWNQYGQQIESVVRKQSQLGFDDEALLRTFSLFVRTTGDVNKALTLNSLATDVARGRYIDLEQAAQLVNKAAIGQAGALRRLGIDVRAGASAQELLTALTEKYGGAAQAASKDATTAMDRAKVSVENLEEALGNALLPTVADLADALAKGADDASAFAQELGKLGGVKIPSIHIPFVFDTPGGTIRGALGSVGGTVLKTAVRVQFFGIGLTAAGLVKDALEDGVDTGLKQSTPDLAASFETSINSMFTNAMRTAATGVKPPDLTPAIQFDKLPGVDTGGPIAASFGSAVDKFIAAAQKQAAEAIRKGRAAISKEAADKARQAQRDAFDNLIAALGLKVDQAAVTRGIVDDLRANTVLQNAIKKQIGVEGRTTELASQLFQARQARSALLGQQAQAAADASAKAAAKIQAAQFRALGLDETGSKPPPTIANLKKQLAQLGARDDLTGTQKGMLARIRKVLIDPIHKATPETRDAIKGLYDTIRSTFRDEANTLAGPRTDTHSIRPNQIVKGLGLDAATTRELRARLSGFNTAGVALTAPRRTQGGFVGGTAPTINLTTTVMLDGDKVGQSVKRFNANDRRHNPRQKRGPNTVNG